MAKQSDFTAEEWTAVSAAPLMAGLLVSLAEVSGPMGVAKEGFAVVREIIGATASPNELVKAVAEGIKAQGRPQMPDIPGDKDAARTLLLDGVKGALAAVKAKAPADVEAYGAWLYGAAQKAAEAAKEGGFLGFGGTTVSDSEKAALAALRAVLGVRA